MLFQNVSAEEKRKRLKENLSSNKLLQFPGSFSPVVSRLIEEKGFDGVYLSGAILSADMGYPDIGLTTLTEVVQRGKVIARASSLPSIIDIDTGFGETMNVARTIQELEEHGISGCHMEDQKQPKRCGHLDHKQLVDVKEMGQKIKTAVKARRDPNFLLIARTDARGVEGLQGAIDRAKAYVHAGAEVIFPEALKDEKEFEAFRNEVSVPLLANMTEFGKSKLLSKQKLEQLGYNLVIYPVSSFRIALGAVEQGFDRMKQEGSQESLLDEMQPRKRLYELLKYEEYNAFDQSIYNFNLEGENHE